jgi:hypothetical protein
VTQFTDWNAARDLNPSQDGEALASGTPTDRRSLMLTSIFIVALILLSLALALRSPHEERLINRRPYNNVHSDATAAREGWLG